MNLEGSGKEPWSGDVSEDGPNIGSSDSDFFTTIRARVGFAFGHWLFYGTGGGIGVNYETKISDPGEGVFGSKQDFDWDGPAAAVSNTCSIAIGRLKANICDTRWISSALPPFGLRPVLTTASTVIPKATSFAPV